MHGLRLTERNAAHAVDVMRAIARAVSSPRIANRAHATWQ